MVKVELVEIEPLVCFITPFFVQCLSRKLKKMSSTIENMEDEGAVDSYLRTLVDNFAFTRVDNYLIRSSSGKIEINKMYYHLSGVFITGDIELYQRLYKVN